MHWTPPEFRDHHIQHPAPSIQHPTSRISFTFALQSSYSNDQQKKYPGESDADALHHQYPGE
jgi:hypothetical protein